MSNKYDLTFYDNWVSEGKEQSLITIFDRIVGTKVRFRDNADRKKNYMFHSPVKAALYSNGMLRWEVSTPLQGSPVWLSLLFNKEELKTYDRFLTLKVICGEENRVCAYIMFKIKPCEVKPLKKGGITEGSEIVGYDISYQNGCDSAVLHSILSLDEKTYATWLEKSIKEEYQAVVTAALKDKELSDPFAVIRYLTDKAEDDIKRAKKLTNQML